MDKIREALAGKEEVRVTCPVATAELRVRDLHEVIDEEDVRRAIASSGACDVESVKVGPIRVVGRGMGTAWAKCPVAAANRLAAAGKLKIGWTKVRIEALEKRPLQCFKCMGKGYVRAQCGSSTDRSMCCYQCAQQGHIARDCTQPVKCPVCADLGRPANHRAGSKMCSAPKKKGKGRNTKVPPPVYPCPRRRDIWE